MSETELSVICKNCGSEVSPYVTECPYCGARLRKRAPKLERRGDGLEPKPRRRSRGRRWSDRAPWSGALATGAPYATIAAIVVSAVMLLVQKATADPISTFGGVIVPLEQQWWRYLSAPFAYLDVGYLFVVAVALALFGVRLERRLGSPATALLLVACGSLGALAGAGIVSAQGGTDAIAGGNGMALGALGAWFTIRHAESATAIDQDYDRIGVAVSAAVLLALPAFESTANVYAGLVGGVVGAAAGLLTATLRAS